MDVLVELSQIREESDRLSKENSIVKLFSALNVEKCVLALRRSNAEWISSLPVLD